MTSLKNEKREFVNREFLSTRCQEPNIQKFPKKEEENDRLGVGKGHLLSSYRINLFHNFDVATMNFI